MVVLLITYITNTKEHGYYNDSLIIAALTFYLHIYPLMIWNNSIKYTCKQLCCRHCNLNFERCLEVGPINMKSLLTIRRRSMSKGKLALLFQSPIKDNRFHRTNKYHIDDTLFLAE